jgi:hypothetical protein
MVSLVVVSVSGLGRVAVVRRLFLLFANTLEPLIRSKLVLAKFQRRRFLCQRAVVSRPPTLEPPRATKSPQNHTRETPSDLDMLEKGIWAFCADRLSRWYECGRCPKPPKLSPQGQVTAPCIATTQSSERLALPGIDIICFMRDVWKEIQQ